MHLGHQALFERLGPHGAVVVIDKGHSTLTPGRSRCRYLSYPCYFLKLEEIKDLDAQGFAHLLRELFPDLRRVVVGYDFAFGKDRRFRPKDLEPFFEVEVVDEVRVDEISIHSRTIRQLLLQGKVAQAARLLGRYYSVEGSVIKGQGIGSKELVPTLNLKIDRYLLPKEGVYATFAIVDGRCYKSVTFIGKRLSTDQAYSVETHIIGAKIFSAQRVRIIFVQFLRPNRVYKRLQDLKKQIEHDIKKAKEVLDEEVVMDYLGVDGALCKRAH